MKELLLVLIPCKVNRVMQPILYSGLKSQVGTCPMVIKFVLV